MMLDGFLSCFVNEFTRDLLTLRTIERLALEFIFSLGVASTIIAILLGTASTLLLLAYPYANEKAARIVILVLAEFLSLVMIGTPFFLPWKAHRFIQGLWVFVAFLTIHSRALHLILPSSQSSSASSAAREPRTLYQSLLQTFFYNLHPSLQPSEPRLPSIKRIVYYFYLLFLIDACLFATYEYIPSHIEGQKRAFATAVTNGIWVLLLMDLNYQTGILYLKTLTHSELPASFTHSHPLLSLSLSEFWGVRWNPIIMKVLQESFYIPLRKIGAPRVWAVIGCFAGSAALHCIPQFLASGSSDAFLMGGFFVIHGGLVVLEIAWKEMLWGKGMAGTLSSPNLVVTGAHALSTAPPARPVDAAENSLRCRSGLAVSTATTTAATTVIASSKSKPKNKKSKSGKRNAYAENELNLFSDAQWAAELLSAIFAVTLINYSYLDSGPVVAEVVVCVGLLGIVAAIGVLSVHWDRVRAVMSECQYDTRLGWAGLWTSGTTITGMPISAVRSKVIVTCLHILAGWAWSLVAVIVTLPMFSIPVFHAMSGLYSRSIVVGGLVRAISADTAGHSLGAM